MGEDDTGTVATEGDVAGAEQTGTVEVDAEEAAVIEEVLVEEISIDGMCGVY
jgi:mycofactocin precursor